MSGAVCVTERTDAYVFLYADSRRIKYGGKRGLVGSWFGTFPKPETLNVRLDTRKESRSHRFSIRIVYVPAALERNGLRLRNDQWI